MVPQRGYKAASQNDWTSSHVDGGVPQQYQQFHTRSGLHLPERRSLFGCGTSERNIGACGPRVGVPAQILCTPVTVLL
jgi:hypothetical protein